MQEGKQLLESFVRYLPQAKNASEAFVAAHPVLNIFPRRRVLIMYDVLCCVLNMHQSPEKQRDLTIKFDHRPMRDHIDLYLLTNKTDDSRMLKNRNEKDFDERMRRMATRVSAVERKAGATPRRDKTGPSAANVTAGGPAFSAGAPKGGYEHLKGSEEESTFATGIPVLMGDEKHLDEGGRLPGPAPKKGRERFDHVTYLNNAYPYLRYTGMRKKNGMRHIQIYITQGPNAGQLWDENVFPQNVCTLHCTPEGCIWGGECMMSHPPVTASICTECTTELRDVPVSEADHALMKELALEELQSNDRNALKSVKGKSYAETAAAMKAKAQQRDDVDWAATTERLRGGSPYDTTRLNYPVSIRFLNQRKTTNPENEKYESGIAVRAKIGSMPRVLPIFASGVPVNDNPALLAVDGYGATDVDGAIDVDIEVEENETETDRSREG